MTEPLYDYDPAAALDSPEAVEVFITDAFETGDASYIAKALGVVARAEGMSNIACTSSSSIRDDGGLLSTVVVCMTIYCSYVLFI